MKAGTLLLIGIGGFIAYQIAQLGTAANTVQIVFSGVQAKGVLDYMLTFLIQNVTNGTLQFNSMAGTVYVNDLEVGNISTFDKVLIMPNSQQPLTLELKPSLLSLPGAVMDVINNGGQIDFTVKGNMNVDTLVLPFNLENKFTV